MTPPLTDAIGNVLLVDDDQLVRDFTAHTIEYGTNRSVETFESGFFAWRYLEQRHESIDLVIADANIPDMDGLELLKKIKERFPGKAVIIMGAEPDMEKKAQQMGADAFISKPFNAEDLFVVARRFALGLKAEPDMEWPTTLPGDCERPE